MQETPSRSQQETPSQTNNITPRKRDRSGYIFFLSGVVLNVVVWSIAFLYLILAPKVYTSKWGVIVLGRDSKVDVTLPDSGRATTSSGEGRLKTFQDPRNDYVYLVTSSAVLEKAAQMMDMKADEFGVPEITTDDDTAIISFAISGETPEISQKKSQVLFNALSQHIETLRTKLLRTRKSEGFQSLQVARKKVQDAQNTLSSYQTTSGYESDQQLEELSVGIENMRRLRSENNSQALGLAGRIAQINNDVDVNSNDVRDAYKLQGDVVYQQQLSAYSLLWSEYSESSAELAPEHPKVINTKNELENAKVALEARGSFLLGRSVNLATLVKIEPLSNDPQTGVIRDEIFKESTINRADQSSLVLQNQHLGLEITKMEMRLANLSQAKFKIDRLRQNLQVAETVLASTLVKLELNSDDVYAIFPPIQLVIEPSLPNSNTPDSPNTRMVLLAALTGSFLVITGLLLLWHDKRDVPQRMKPSTEYLQSLLSSSSSEEITKEEN